MPSSFTGINSTTLGQMTTNKKNRDYFQYFEKLYEKSEQLDKEMYKLQNYEYHGCGYENRNIIFLNNLISTLKNSNKGSLSNRDQSDLSKLKINLKIIVVVQIIKYFCLQKIDNILHKNVPIRWRFTYICNILLSESPQDEQDDVEYFYQVIKKEILDQNEKQEVIKLNEICPISKLRLDQVIPFFPICGVGCFL